MCPELQDVALQDAQQEAAAPNSERNLFSSISLLRGTIAEFYVTETSGGTCKHNWPLHTLGILLWTAPVLFCPLLLSILLNPKKTQLSGDTLLPIPSDKSIGKKTPAQVLQTPKWEITLHKPNGCSLTSCIDSKTPKALSEVAAYNCFLPATYPPIEKQHKIASLLSVLELTGKSWGPGCSGWPTPAARALGRAVLLPASLFLKLVYLCLP